MKKKKEQNVKGHDLAVIVKIVWLRIKNIIESKYKKGIYALKGKDQKEQWMDGWIKEKRI